MRSLIRAYKNIRFNAKARLKSANYTYAEGIRLIDAYANQFRKIRGDVQSLAKFYNDKYRANLVSSGKYEIETVAPEDVKRALDKINVELGVFLDKMFDVQEDLINKRDSWNN